MPDGQTIPIKSEIAKEYYKWLAATYGYWSAEIDPNSPYFQYFLFQYFPQNYAALHAPQGPSPSAQLDTYLQAYGSSPDNAIRTLLPEQDPTTGSYIFRGDSYIERLGNFLDKLVSSNTMSWAQREEYIQRAAQSIEGGTPAEQLPYMNELQRPDYKAWETGMVQESRTYNVNEDKRQELIAELSQKAVGDDEYQQSLKDMSAVELITLKNRLDFQDQQSPMIEEQNRRLAIAKQVAELNPQPYAEGNDPNQMLTVGKINQVQQPFDLTSGQGARAVANTQDLANQSVRMSIYGGTEAGKQAMTQERFNNLMINFVPTTAQNVADVAPSAAVGQFYSGQRGQAIADRYNKALADWNWTIAQAETDIEFGIQSNQGTNTNKTVVQDGVSYYAPINNGQGGEQAAIMRLNQEKDKGFASLADWTKGTDWYTQFLTTPKQARPYGYNQEKLSPRVRNY